MGVISELGVKRPGRAAVELAFPQEGILAVRLRKLSFDISESIVGNTVPVPAAGDLLFNPFRRVPWREREAERDES
jgi:hypothetical protein